MTDASTRRAAVTALTNGDNITPVAPPILLASGPFFELAGEEFGRRLLLTSGIDGMEYCMRPDFTLPIAIDYLNAPEAGQPAAYGYLGPVFRQRQSGPTEFDQAGIELISQPDPDEALDRVIGFALDALKIYDLKPQMRLGAVDIFEAFLAQADMPDVWRSRIRHRFGHDEAMTRLLGRLSDPHTASSGALPWKRDDLVNVITDQMIEAGLSLTGSRAPEEIATRYFEKQELAAARVPSETISMLRSYLAVSNDARTALIQLEGLADDQGINIKKPLARLERHIEALENADTIGAIQFDGGFAPRLDYYTGIVFEVEGQSGNLASGGEYGRLMQRLGATAHMAASGCAVWVDRLEQERGK